MTLNYERRAAVLRTREFLFSLTDPQQTPNVPAGVRSMAKSLVKHYPNEDEIRELGRSRPDILGTNWEDSYPGRWTHD